MPLLGFKSSKFPLRVVVSPQKGIQGSRGSGPFSFGLIHQVVLSAATCEPPATPGLQSLLCLKSTALAIPSTGSALPASLTLLLQLSLLKSRFLSEAPSDYSTSVSTSPPTASTLTLPFSAFVFSVALISYERTIYIYLFMISIVYYLEGIFVHLLTAGKLAQRKLSTNTYSIMNGERSRAERGPGNHSWVCG